MAVAVRWPQAGGEGKACRASGGPALVTVSGTSPARGRTLLWSL